MFVLTKPSVLYKCIAFVIGAEEGEGVNTNKSYPQVYPHPVYNYVDKAPLSGRLPSRFYFF
jgi:hypothetical protein